MSKHGKKIFFALLAVSVAVSALYCLRCYYSFSGFVFRLVVKSVFTALRIGFGLFRALFAKSLIFIWFPVLSHLAISLFTKTRFARTLFLFAAVVIHLALLLAALRHYSVYVFFSVSAFLPVFSAMVHFYLFLLFLLTAETWNFIGGLVFVFKGAAVALLPDFPSFIDDFGVIVAVFSFIFLYLNTVAFLAKRAGEFVFTQDSSRLLFYTRAAANYFGKFRKKNIG